MGFKMRAAERRRSRLRMTIAGVSKSGKTYTALRFAPALVGSTDADVLRKSIVVIASESGMVDKYIGDHPDGFPWQFSVCDLDNFSPSDYRDAVIYCGKQGFKVIIIDSLSHAWEGSGGALEMVDKAGGSKFTSGWSKVTPMHRAMLEAIQRSPAHVIATMRTKADYVLETNERGQSVPRKVGTREVQREDVDYEFDICCRIDNTHTLTIDGGRCPTVDGAVAVKPAITFMDPIIHWLNDGVDVDDSYYTANEEDLRRSAEARRLQEEEALAAAKKKAPKKTAAEYKAEKEAKESKEVADARAINEQAEIDRLKNEAAAKIAEMDKQGAKLSAAAEGVHADAQHAAKPADPTVSGVASGTTADQSSVKLATRQQCMEIVDSCKALYGPDVDAVKTKLKSLLDLAKVGKVSELRAEDATMLGDKLRAAIAKRAAAAEAAAKKPDDPPEGAGGVLVKN